MSKEKLKQYRVKRHRFGFGVFCTIKNKMVYTFAGKGSKKSAELTVDLWNKS